MCQNAFFLKKFTIQTTTLLYYLIIGVMCNYHSSLKTAFCMFFVKTAIYERIFFYLCTKILSKEDTILWQTKKSRANSRHSLCPISA